MARKTEDDRGYALDLNSPARHLRTALDTAADAPVSIRVVAQDYEHPIPADFTRVKHHHKQCTNKHEAKLFMLTEAARQMEKWLVVHENADDVWISLREGYTPDDLRLNKSKVHPVVNPHKVLRDLFNPNGEFAKNIRAPNGHDDMEELRQSMRTFGWIEQLPAIVDERGVILIGHRRLKVAEELGIEPNIKPITFGDGDPADAKRLGVALASNLGGKPMTPSDRKRIAIHMRLEHGWTLEAIAALLRSTTSTIGRDTSDATEGCVIPSAGNTQLKRGPKKNIQQKVVPSKNAERDAEIIEMHRRGMKQPEIAKHFNIKVSAVRGPIEDERLREEGRQQALAEQAYRPPTPLADVIAATADEDEEEEELKPCAHCEKIAVSKIQYAIGREMTEEELFRFNS